MFTNTTLIKWAIILALLSGMVFSIYNAGYNAGVSKANTDCLLAQKSHSDEIDKHIQGLITAVSGFAITLDDKQSLLTTDMQSILARVKTQQITIIKDGKCLPSPEFLNSLTQAVNRVNGI